MIQYLNDLSSFQFDVLFLVENNCVRKVIVFFQARTVTIWLRGTNMRENLNVTLGNMSTLFPKRLDNVSGGVGIKVPWTNYCVATTHCMTTA